MCKYVRDVLTKDYFFTVLRFLYDMEIIEFVKPLDDTELDEFSLWFCYIMGYTGRVPGNLWSFISKYTFCVAVLRRYLKSYRSAYLIYWIKYYSEVLLRVRFEVLFIIGWADNTGKLHFDNMILTDSILSLDTEIKRIPYYVFMAHIDLTGRIFDWFLQNLNNTFIKISLASIISLCYIKWVVKRVMVLCAHISDGYGSKNIRILRRNTMNDYIKNLEASQMKESVDKFNVGDTVKVHNRIKEGNKERIQIFRGYSY